MNYNMMPKLLKNSSNVPKRWHKSRWKLFAVNRVQQSTLVWDAWLNARQIQPLITALCNVIWLSIRMWYIFCKIDKFHFYLITSAGWNLDFNWQQNWLTLNQKENLKWSSWSTKTKSGQNRQKWNLSLIKLILHKIE